MASKFTISHELLTYLLDLPKDAKLGDIKRIPVGNDDSIYEIAVSVPDWPEGPISLVYGHDDVLGIVSLVTVAPRLVPVPE